MTQAGEKTGLTLDEFMALDGHYEIIDGRLVSKYGDDPMTGAGALHQFLAQNANRILDHYVFPRGIGAILGDNTTFHMHSNPQSLKDTFEPDVAFVRADTIPSGWDIEKPFPGVPTLAIEVISPGEKAAEIMGKVRAYLEKGTEEVWLMFPRTTEVHQYQQGIAQPRVYVMGDTLDASALFPGIEGLTVQALFALPEWLTTQLSST
jgi:Uma2 family endonuclease